MGLGQTMVTVWIVLAVERLAQGDDCGGIETHDRGKVDDRVFGVSDFGEGVLELMMSEVHQRSDGQEKYSGRQG